MLHVQEIISRTRHSIQSLMSRQAIQQINQLLWISASLVTRRQRSRKQRLTPSPCSAHGLLLVSSADIVPMFLCIEAHICYTQWRMHGHRMLLLARVISLYVCGIVHMCLSSHTSCWWQKLQAHGGSPPQSAVMACGGMGRSSACHAGARQLHTRLTTSCCTTSQAIESDNAFCCSQVK